MMQPPDDSELRMRYREGDREAFEILWRRYERSFYFQALQHARGNNGVAEDAVSDLSEQLSRPGTKACYDPKRPWRSWAGTILIHKVCDRRRQAGRRRQRERPLESIPDLSVKDSVSWEDLGTELADCLRRLAAEQLALLQLRFVDILTLKEIAQQQSFGSLTSIFRKVSAALNELKDCLKKKGFGE
jgi:RNA polymerase sigma factor (sigma-70 family)